MGSKFTKYVIVAIAAVMMLALVPVYKTAERAYADEAAGDDYISLTFEETSTPNKDYNKVMCYGVGDIIKLKLTVTVNKTLKYKDASKATAIHISLRDSAGNWLTEDQMKAYSVNDNKDLKNFSESGKDFTVTRNHKADGRNYVYIDSSKLKQSINAMTFTVEYRHTVAAADCEKGVNYIDPVVYIQGIEAVVETKECTENVTVASNAIQQLIQPPTKPEGPSSETLKVEYCDPEGNVILTDERRWDGGKPIEFELYGGEDPQYLWTYPEYNPDVSYNFGKAFESQFGGGHSNAWNKWLEALGKFVGEGQYLAGWTTIQGGPVEYGYFGDMYMSYDDYLLDGDMSGSSSLPTDIEIQRDIKLYPVVVNLSDVYRLGFAVGITHCAGLEGAADKSEKKHEQYGTDGYGYDVLIEQAENTASGARKYWQSGMFTSPGEEVTICRYAIAQYNPKRYSEDAYAEYPAAEVTWLCWFDKHSGLTYIPGDTITITAHEHTLDAFWAHIGEGPTYAYDGDEHPATNEVEFIGETKSGSDSPKPISEWLGEKLTYEVEYSAIDAAGYDREGKPTFTTPGRHEYTVSATVTIQRDGTDPLVVELAPVGRYVNITYELQEDDVEESTSVFYTGEHQLYAPEVTYGHGAGVLSSSNYNITYQDKTGKFNGNDRDNYGRITDVGELTVTIEGWYPVSGKLTRTFKILPAPVTITANDETIYVGDGLPSPTAKVDGKPDKGVALDYTVELAPEASSDTPATYDIIVKPGTNPNYDVTPVNGTLTVLKPTHFDLIIDLNEGNIAGNPFNLTENFEVGDGVTLTPCGFSDSGATPITHDGAVLLGYSTTKVSDQLGTYDEIEEAVSDSGAMLFESGEITYIMPDDGGIIYCLWASDSNDNGIADAYEITVNFSGSHGTVSPSSAVYGLYTDGDYDIAGTATLDFSGIDLTPDDKYISDGGYWEDKAGVHVTSTRTLTKADDSSTFTYHFVPHGTKLTVTKEPDKTVVKPGEEISWTVTVKNEGNTTLDNIILVDQLDGVSTTSLSENIYIGGAAVTVLELEPGESESFLVSYTALESDIDTEVVNSMSYKSSIKESPSERGPAGTVSSAPVEVKSEPVVPPSPPAETHVTFYLDANGGTFDTGLEETTVTDPKSQSDLPTPTYEGYTFDGWFEAGRAISTDIFTDYLDHHLQAQWTKNAVTPPSPGPTVPPSGPTEPTTSVTFHLDANGGEFDGLVTRKDVTDPRSAADLPTPTRVGYTFTGWFENGAAMSNAIFSDGLDHTLVAQWKADEVHTTFHLDAGDGEFDDGTSWRDVIDPPSLDKLPTPSRDGYNFDGWYEDGSPVDVSSLNDGGVHNLEAHWKKKPSSGGYVAPDCYVTFDSEGGSPVAGQYVTWNSTVSRPKDPTKEGYTFDDWYTKDGDLFDFSKDRVLGNLTLYARWSSNSSFIDEHIAYIVGRDDGLVHPNDYITRAEISTIFYRLLRRDVRNQYRTTETDFVDVPANAWYTEAVATLENLGVVYGKGNGIFDPNAPITRAEFAAIVVRFDYIYTSVKTYFSDVSSTHWAYTYIGTAAQNGWIVGRDDGLFHPEDNITRAEAITLVNRALGRSHLTEYSFSDIPDMITWPDNEDKKKWYYLAIQEATNSHTYIEVSEVEYWDEIIR